MLSTFSGWSLLRLRDQRGAVLQIARICATNKGDLLSALVDEAAGRFAGREARMSFASSSGHW